MHIFIERTNEKKQIHFNGTVVQLLAALKINPEAVIVSRNHELLTEAEHIQTTDEIQILSVVSGG